MSSFIGTSGNDSLTGTSGADTFDMTQGGVDSVTANRGDDTMDFGAKFTAADTIKGGAGFDILELDGDYSAGVTLTGATMSGVERITIANDGNDYKLVTANANVAAGSFLTVLAYGLGAGHSLYFDGSHETDGNFYLAGGQGDDTLIGSSNANGDYFDAGAGEDTLIGRGGYDNFYFGANFDAGDHVEAAPGSNAFIDLNGDYSAGVTLAADTIANIGSIQLLGDFGYKLTLVDANVSAGTFFTVNGENIVGHAVVINASHESDGQLQLLGGSGKDTLTAGAGADFLTGNGGADDLKGGGGADNFIYAASSDSTSTRYDRVHQFDAASDVFNLWVAVTGVNSKISGGSLTKATFDSNLASAVDAGHLGAHHAVLFAPGSGDQAGKTFLVVDVNGTAGYQASADLVIELPGMTHAASFDTPNFV